METHRDSRTAPFHAVPPRRLVSVEHPAVVRNLNRAMDTLQGNAGIEKVSLLSSVSGDACNYANQARY